MQISDLSFALRPAREAANTPVPANITSSPALLQGVVSAHPKGFGFVVTADEQEFFLPPSEMRRVVPGDTVDFHVTPGQKPDTTQACVRSIVRRPSTVWQGVLVAKDKKMVLKPDVDSPCFVQLTLPHLSYCPTDVVVSVRVEGFEQAAHSARKPVTVVPVQLERVLGPRTREGFIQDYALARFDFPLDFSERALEEAGAAARQPIDAQDRVDLREIPLVTIDGESTRDFDDAVYARPTEYGWEVVVAIADVSHYVAPNSALDREARARSTSVYLPGRTLPMLPEALSVGACSLIPGVDRLVVALILQVSPTGELLGNGTVSRAIARSAQRLTYSEVQAWSQGEFQVAPHVQPSLAALWDLYRTLATRRSATGRMEHESPEPKLMPKDDGTFDMDWVPRTDAHRLVEELMLLSNRMVAQRLDAQGQGVFRHQPLPDAERWAVVREFAAGQGRELPEAPDLPALAAMVKSLDGDAVLKAELHARNCMNPAIYSHTDKQHFSLNFQAYTHFTSPIRRYADLLVHRLLLAPAQVDAKGLPGMVEQCSQRNRGARLAERLVWDVLKKTGLWTGHQANPESHAGYVVNQSRNGVRAVVTAWQTAVFVNGKALQDVGYRYEASRSAWCKEGHALELGSTLTLHPAARVDDDSRIEILAGL